MQVCTFTSASTDTGSFLTTTHFTYIVVTYSTLDVFFSLCPCLFKSHLKCTLFLDRTLTVKSERCQSIPVETVPKIILTCCSSNVISTLNESKLIHCHTLSEKKYADILLKSPHLKSHVALS